MDQLQDFIQLLVLVLDVVHTVIEYILVLGVTIEITYGLIDLETLFVDLVHVFAQFVIINMLFLLVDRLCLTLGGGGTEATQGFGVLNKFFLNNCFIFFVRFL